MTDFNIACSTFLDAAKRRVEERQSKCAPFKMRGQNLAVTTIWKTEFFTQSSHTETHFLNINWKKNPFAKHTNIYLGQKPLTVQNHLVQKNSISTSFTVTKATTESATGIVGLCIRQDFNLDFNVTSCTWHKVWTAKRHLPLSFLKMIEMLLPPALKPCCWKMSFTKKKQTQKQIIYCSVPVGPCSESSFNIQLSAMFRVS